MSPEELKHTLEAALLAAGRALRLEDLELLFEDDAPPRGELRAALAALARDWEGRSLELVEVAGGFRAQIRAEWSGRIGRLWAERPARYSRALLETLALIAYRQPITRGEIEEVRGVSVSASIIRTLLERDWVRVLGHKEVPGRPALFGTTRTFLDYFGLKSLQDLPPLAEVRELVALEDDLFAGLEEGAGGLEVGPAQGGDGAAAEAGEPAGEHEPGGGGRGEGDGG